MTRDHLTNRKDTERAIGGSTGMLFIEYNILNSSIFTVISINFIRLTNNHWYLTKDKVINLQESGIGWSPETFEILSNHSSLFIIIHVSTKLNL